MSISELKDGLEKDEHDTQLSHLKKIDGPIFDDFKKHLEHTLAQVIKKDRQQYLSKVIYFLSNQFKT